MFKATAYQSSLKEVKESMEEGQQHFRIESFEYLFLIIIVFLKSVGAGMLKSCLDKAVNHLIEKQAII